ncbi:MAG: response regulator [Calditrichota bacterium]
MNTVLIADDDPSMIHILSHILKSEGYRVLQENNGLAALETARRERPDLVILDLMMPLLDGIGVLMKLYGDDPPFKSPAILLTAQDSAEYRDLAESFGVVRFVEKPFDLDDLIRTIKESVAAKAES